MNRDENKGKKTFKSTCFLDKSKMKSRQEKKLLGISGKRAFINSAAMNKENIQRCLWFSVFEAQDSIGR